MGNILLNARHWTSLKTESAKSPPVCVVGVGEGVGLDPNLSMAYQSGFRPGSCFLLILMNEIWVSLWHFGIRFKLLFKDQCLVSYDQKKPVLWVNICSRR